MSALKAEISSREGIEEALQQILTNKLKTSSMLELLNGRVKGKV